MAHIFISYARSEQASNIVNKLANRLRADEHIVFVDVQSMEGSVNWEEKIIERISQCDLLVMLITDATLNSEGMFFEFDYASKNNKPILPLWIDDAKLPPFIRARKINAIKVESNDIGEMVRQVERTLRISSSKKIPLRTRTILGTLVALISIILAFLALFPEDIRSSWFCWYGDSCATQIAQTPTDIPTNTPEPSTPVYTPTITLTRTPRPSNTPRPPANTPTLILTSTEIFYELILYEEDFEDGIADGFNLESGGWRIITEDNGNHVYEGRAGSAALGVWFGSPSWGNYSVELRVRQITPQDVLVQVRSNNYCGGCYALRLSESDRAVLIEKDDSTSDTTLLNFDDFDDGIRLYSSEYWNIIRIDVNGDVIRVTYNEITTYVYDDEYTEGFVRLTIAPDAYVWFDDIRVWSLDTD